MPRYSKSLPPKQRKHPYFENRETETGLGGWNADATMSDRPKGDLSEVLNMRKMRHGELEVRTGYRQYYFPDPSVNGATQPQIPLWKAEYRMDDVFVDVTFFSQGGTVYAKIFNPSTELNRTETICTCGSNPKVCAVQFQTYLIVSVLNRDVADPNDSLVFALSPNSADKATLVTLAWQKISLGKQVTPAPATVSFAPLATGKLYVFQPDPTSGAVLKYEIDPLTGDPRTIALDIKAQYFATNQGPVAGLSLRQFTYAKGDVSGTGVGEGHLKSRGWWCRAVLKRKYTDARGQTHIVTEAPSTDWYVEERTYEPATIHDRLSPIEFTDRIYGSGVFPIFVPWTRVPGTNNFLVRDGNGSGNINFGPAVAYPTLTDWQNLQAKVRGAIGNPDITSPYFFAAMWLGLGFVFDVDFPADIPPYMVDVGSHLVNGSPNATYMWSDFGLNPNTDSTLYQIDFYRTAYSYPDEKDNAIRSPLWGTAYNYGFVGTLHAADAVFTDDVADTALLFEESPLDAEGYLEGEFAGEVIRPYQDHLVLGNTRTKYRVRTPWSGIQAFKFTAENTTGFVANDFGFVADGLQATQWYYRYVDRDGHKSNAVAINLPLPLYGAGSGQSINVAFMFPRGYSDTIVSAELIRSVWDSGSSTRKYFLEATVALSTGSYIATIGDTGAYLPANASTTSISDTAPIVSDDPGYIIWSKINDPWAWPQENIENEHDQNPVTALDEVIGPLYVASDKGVVMTRLNGYREPVHTSGTGVGCISRYACVKVDKVVFMMSASGLIYIEGSGVVPMSADISTEINIRLREIIQGQPSLYGVRERVSMSYLANRKELWITFPSTIERGGTLPARTFIVKFLEGKTYAYEFQVSIPHHDGGLNSGEAKGVVIHLPHADGTMWSAFHDDGDASNPDPNKQRPPILYLQDNDDARLHWKGHWSFQYEEALGMPNVTKTVNQVNFLAASMSKFYQVTGMVRTDGQRNAVQGTLLGPAREIVNQPIGSPTQAQIEAYDLPVSEYHLPVSGSLIETTGTPPGVRYYGEPDQFGQNKFKIQSLDVYFDPKFQHKGD